MGGVLASWQFCDTELGVSLVDQRGDEAGSLCGTCPPFSQNRVQGARIKYLFTLPVVRMPTSCMIYHTDFWKNVWMGIVLSHAQSYLDLLCLIELNKRYAAVQSYSQTLWKPISTAGRICLPRHVSIHIPHREFHFSVNWIGIYSPNPPPCVRKTTTRHGWWWCQFKSTYAISYTEMAMIVKRARNAISDSRRLRKGEVNDLTGNILRSGLDGHI